MTTSIELTNDNSGMPSKPAPDPHGQAALMLSESILHALVEKSTFSVQEALVVIEIACEVKEEVAEQTDESRDRMNMSLHLLRQIGKTFRADAI